MKPETAKRTALEWLEYEFVKLESTIGVHSRMYHLIEQAKEMEKAQAIELIKQTAMFMAASNLDEDIANMSYEDVYKTYYNETFNTNG